MKGRFSIVGACLLVSGMGALAPAPAVAQTFTDIQAAMADEGSGGREIHDFYASRDFRPIWLRDAVSRRAAERLIELMASADLDGLKPGRYKPNALRDALEDSASGDPEDIAEAEMQISRSFVAWVRDMRVPRRPSPIAFTDPSLRPQAPDAAEVLGTAAAAKPLGTWVENFGWMHPLYGPLRKALGTAWEDSTEARALRMNLERVRPLPTDPRERHIVVDTAGQRLLMYQNGRPVDSMRVVVGRLDNPTPMLASTIRFATLNPYWNVPVDLARDRIAPDVLKNGNAWLARNGYDVLSDWAAEAKPVDPSLVDWEAVAQGRRMIRVRQRPGPGNGMGAMKFTFPNDMGIYLHDTPNKALFRQNERLGSAGCIRLEDAPRLARWLFGKPLTAKSKKPELQVELPKPVPVYITYLTAFPNGQRVEYREDLYGRDSTQVARTR